MNTSQKAYLQHAGGIEKLVEMSGPHRYMEYPDHGYFLIARPLIIGQAMFNRQPTFLDEPQWNTIPWAKHPETRTLNVQLSDIGAHIPRLYADFGSVSARRSDIQPEAWTATIFSLQQRLKKLVRDLCQWRKAWEQVYPAEAHAVPLDITQSWIVSGSGEALYDTVLKFQSFQAARTYSLWNVRIRTCLMLGIKLGLQGPLVTVQPIDAPATAPSISLRQLGDEYARLVDYFLLERHRTPGAYALMWGLRTIIIHFTFFKEDVKLRWAKDLYTKCLSVREGFALSADLPRTRIPGTGQLFELLRS